MGLNANIVILVVLNHVKIQDGCLIKGSIICSSVHLQERAMLGDCHVGLGYVIAFGTKHWMKTFTNQNKKKKEKA
jgi:translation initiation factor eIF-2B subunit gamma